VIRLVFAVTICFGIWHRAGAAVTAGAKDCIALEDSEPEDALTYRNDCNRSVMFYYCVPSAPKWRPAAASSPARGE
jgi:hypothetical protein